MQWADLHSLQALSFALRRLHADPILGLVATRDATLKIPEGLRRLARDRGQLIRLGGLGPEELGALAVRVGVEPLPRRALERLREHTGGNPLHAKALLEELPAAALHRVDGPLPAPRSFALLVLARLAACSFATRDLVEAVSVLGVRSEVALAARVAEVDDPASALDEAVAASLLEIHEMPTAVFVAFPHTMVRAAVYDNLGRAKRSVLHRRAGELLEGPASVRHRATVGSGPTIVSPRNSQRWRGTSMVEAIWSRRAGTFWLRREWNPTRRRDNDTSSTASSSSWPVVRSPRRAVSSTR